MSNVIHIISTHNCFFVLFYLQWFIVDEIQNHRVKSIEYTCVVGIRHKSESLWVRKYYVYVCVVGLYFIILCYRAIDRYLNPLTLTRLEFVSELQTKSILQSNIIIPYIYLPKCISHVFLSITTTCDDHHKRFVLRWWQRCVRILTRIAAW